MKVVVEEWKLIEGCTGYEISDLGRIRSLKFNNYGRVIKLWKTKGGYSCAFLWKEGRPKTKDVHRLVAIHFVSNPENKREVNHINGNKIDNRAENLQWVSPSENQQHAISLGLRKDRGEDSINSKLTERQVIEIRELYRASKITYKEISKTFGIHRDYVGLLIRRERWAHI